MEVDPAFYNAAYNLARLDIAVAISSRPQAVCGDAGQGSEQRDAAACAGGTSFNTGGSQAEFTAAIGARSRRTDLRPARLALITFLVQKRDSKALAAAQSAQVMLPDDPAILNALSVSQLMADSIPQALETFNHLTRVPPGTDRG
jgi:Flp pilus assembly protein TadD